MTLEEQELTNKVIGNIIIQRQPWKVYLYILGGLISFILILLAVSLISDVPVRIFTRDPLQIVDAPFYTGILSNIGILFWSAACSVCLFTYFGYRAYPNSSFLLFSGILTLALLLDDFFLFHEVVYRNYLHIPQKVIFTVYLISVIYMLFKFKTTIYESEFVFLFSSLFFFFLSGIFDVIPQNYFTFHHLFEDGFKFIGIIFWSVYYIRTSFSYLKIKNADIHYSL